MNTKITTQIFLLLDHQKNIKKRILHTPHFIQEIKKVCFDPIQIDPHLVYTEIGHRIINVEADPHKTTDLKGTPNHGIKGSETQKRIQLGQMVVI